MHVLRIPDYLVDNERGDAADRVRPQLKSEIELWCKENLQYDHHVRSIWPKSTVHEMTDMEIAWGRRGRGNSVTAYAPYFTVEFFNENDALFFKMWWFG